MPFTEIQIKQKAKVETQKFKGWEMLRIFKASALTSDLSGNFFTVTDTENLIQKFTQAYVENYKGTNLIYCSKLDNFNSFRITANGTIPCNDEDFLLTLKFYDFTYNEIASISPNYGAGFNVKAGGYADWYLDVELTYAKDPNGYHTFVSNGKYIVSPKGNLSELHMIPLNGNVNLIDSENFYFDIMFNDNASNILEVKQINIDFVE